MPSPGQCPAPDPWHSPASCGVMSHAGQSFFLSPLSDRDKEVLLSSQLYYLPVKDRRASLCSRHPPPSFGSPHAGCCLFLCLGLSMPLHALVDPAVWQLRAPHKSISTSHLPFFLIAPNLNSGLYIKIGKFKASSPWGLCQGIFLPVL